MEFAYFVIKVDDNFIAITISYKLATRCSENKLPHLILYCERVLIITKGMSDRKMVTDNKKAQELQAL